jgi:uncharacterized protein (TIGR03118 family)
MNGITRHLGSAAILALAVSGATAVRADDDDFNRQRNAYLVTPLVSDISKLGGKVIDSNLKNAWGVTFSPAASPFWISDNATGLATLYDGDGTIVNVVVKIPCPTTAGQGSSCPTTAAPTGTVWNPTTGGFLVPGTTTASHFIFATEDGTISAWASGPAATIAVNNATVPNTNGAVYKGLAVGVNVNGVIVNGGTSPTFVFLYATNFRAGTIDVFDAGFNQVKPGTPGKIDGSFTDPNIPAGYAPFGIQNINGDLFVTYAKQDTHMHDDVAGAGNGFVDVFDTNGFLLRRFASRGPLNSPWGVARASFAFGQFSGDILVGNFGNGKINVFSSRGRFIDELDDSHGKTIAIDGLWTLTLGGGAKSSSDTLYFTAGPNGETDGLFGTITPVSGKGDDD